MKPRKLPQIFVNGKNKHLGLFEIKEDAKKAREKANKEYLYHTNHGKELNYGCMA